MPRPPPRTDVLGERGLRPRRDPRRGRRERERRRAIAAHRPSPSSSSGPDCCRRAPPPPGADRYIRKAKELIQSLAADRRVPGREGQGTDHLRLPQPDLLRPRCLRGSGGRRCLLRGHGPLEADAGPGGAPRRPAEVALNARPVPLRGARRGRQARGQAGLAAGRSPGTTSSRTSRPRDGRTSPGDSSGSPRRTGRARRRPAALVPRATLHVAGPAAARGDPR